jgi:hypothetical protein
VTDMTQPGIKDALDQAFAAEFGKLFGMLVENLEMNDPQALDHFTNGLAARLKAYQVAAGVADKLVKS